MRHLHRIRPRRANVWIREFEIALGHGWPGCQKRNNSETYWISENEWVNHGTDKPVFSRNKCCTLLSWETLETLGRRRSMSFHWLQDVRLWDILSRCLSRANDRNSKSSNETVPGGHDRRWMWRVTIWDKRVRKGGAWEIRMWCVPSGNKITSHPSECLLRLTYRLHLYDLSRPHDFISIYSFRRSVCPLSITILPPLPSPTAPRLSRTTPLSTPTIWITGGSRSLATVVLARPL